jgi:pimeloyl-ACP methyl ester carboxylesterase
MNYYRATLRYISPLPQVEKPAVRSLIIWGTGDGALVKQIPELTQQYLDNVTVRYIEGASHWVQHEEPAQVNQLMRQFLNPAK